MEGSRRYQVYSMSISDTAQATLIGIGAGVAISQFVLASEAGIAENIIQVGAPIAIGGAVANIGFVPGPHSPPVLLQKGLIAGSVGAGVLMAAGALPVAFDAPLLGFVGLVGASVIIGEMATSAVKW